MRRTSRKLYRCTGVHRATFDRGEVEYSIELNRCSVEYLVLRSPLGRQNVVRAL